MKTYALIQLGLVHEIIPPAVYDAEAPDWVEGNPSRIGLEIPIEQRYTAELVSCMADITGMDPQPVQGWVGEFENGAWAVFPYVAPPPTAAQVLASQSAKLVGLKSVANAQKVALTNRIGELTDAVEYEVATPEEVAELPLRVAQRKAWGLYSIDLGRVTSQEGWPPDVVWPTQPEEGMDLSVSAVSGRSTSAQ